MNFDVRLVAALACAAALSACAAERPRPAPPPRPVATSRTTVTSTRVPMPVQQMRPVSSSLAVAEEIAQACNLHLASVAEAPKFDFDESDLLPDDYAVLAQIGDCITTGPLKGRRLTLVGRADPRGTEEYNMVLGAQRAHAVASYLEQIGVDAARLEETSRGALDATGRDEAGWRTDRRVDVTLAK